MKSLKELIIESKKEEYQDIFDRCAAIQGETNFDDANDLVNAMTKYFTSRSMDTSDMTDFQRDYKDGYFYLIFDKDNYLMCFWDYNKFKAATIQIEGKKAWVNGNLYYSLKEIINWVKIHTKQRLGIWVTD